MVRLGNGYSAIHRNRNRWLQAKGALKEPVDKKTIKEKKGGKTLEELEAVVDEVFKKPKATPKVKKSLLSTLLRKDS